MKAFCDGGGIDEVALTDLTRNVAVDALQLNLPLHGDEGSVCLWVDGAFQFRFEATSTPGNIHKTRLFTNFPVPIATRLQHLQ